MCGNGWGVLNTFVSIFCNENPHYLGISELEDCSACTHSLHLLITLWEVFVDVGLGLVTCFGMESVPGFTLASGNI